MYTSTIAASLLLFSTAFAAYGAADASTTSTTPSSTASTSPSDPTHTILVGKDTLKFTPNVTFANPGTKLEFHFYPQNHSVAQSSFANPCEPNTNGTSFFSGAVPTTEGANVNVFTVDVNDTKPIWFYCGAPTHCKKGMVGAVNVPADGSKTVEQFAVAAAKIDTTVNVANKEFVCVAS
ncbi:extracellular serine-rich protein [Rutstroemia sp. NJR-2017a WRK4]|nr:extracellular serine-rich protein [Rutstroemia sp. NJR-2017a WRK4]